MGKELKKNRVKAGLSMVLCTLIFALLLACQSPWPPEMGSESQEVNATNKEDPAQVTTILETAPHETTSEGLPAPDQVYTVTFDQEAVDLQLGMSLDQVKALMGEPIELKQSLEITRLGYGYIHKEKDANSQPITFLTFLDNLPVSYDSHDQNLSLYKDFRPGQSIIPIIREHGISVTFQDQGLNLEPSMTDKIMLNHIAGLNAYGSLHLDYIDEQERVKFKLNLELPSGLIRSISALPISDYNRVVQLSKTDFFASPKAIIDRFGYPASIYIGQADSIEFRYENENYIVFSHDGHIKANDFYIHSNWIPPNEIQIGDHVKRLIDSLGLPQELKKIGIRANMTEDEVAAAFVDRDLYFSDSSDSSFFYHYNLNPDARIRGMHIKAFIEAPYYIEKDEKTFEVPEFDKNKIGNVDDLYIGGLDFSSSPLQVMGVLGLPEKVILGSGEYTNRNEECFFDQSKVHFMDRVDYTDATSGRLFQFTTTDPTLVGPRGLRVGDPIERVLDVFPHDQNLNFKEIKALTPLYRNPDTGYTDLNGASIYPDPTRPYTGLVNINIEWVCTILIEYEDGIITSIGLYMHLC